MDFKSRFVNWQRSQAGMEYERNRTAHLNGPLPKNDPRLFEKVRVKVIRPFYNEGVLQTPESGVILLARHDAESLQAIGKVSLVTE